MDVQKKKVFVGMSGGVDSSVSALLLQKEGYEVVGVFIKVWQADFLPCTWREERRDAMRAAAHLGIPLITLDLEKAYKEEVVDYMIREYSEGRVPNPDVMCNKHVKFGAFLDFAKKNGADFIATGHYARITQVQGQPLYALMAGVDKEKDQSYFLWTLTEAQLAHTLFPVGHLQKSEVRMYAKEFGLPNAEKKDSQGLCFMGAVDMADFLKHYIQCEEGAVLDTEGGVIGVHQGAMLYAIGQRHGFVVTNDTAHTSPLFVVSKDVTHNTITVAQHEFVAMKPAPQMVLEQVNIPSLLADEPLVCEARTRYRGNLHTATLMSDGKSVTARIEKAEELVSFGQSIVFYAGEVCLGGAVVSSSVD